ncbi:MAG: riboflavin biosynthesis protein RibF, partial [Dehalococcoidia bacterium]
FASIDVIEGPTVATIGTFDGVHLGHRALIQRVKHEAENRNANSVAIVFVRQPRAYITPDAVVSYLCDFEDRKSMLNELGVDQIIPIEFGAEIQKLSAQTFVAGLHETFNLRALVVGPGARIGSDRVGVEQLNSSNSSAIAGIEFISVAAEMIEDQQVSSSAIRNAIKAGHLEIASKMLGRNYSIEGPVAGGDERGRELGFPTANIEQDPGITVPDNGIYATLAEVDGKIYQAATSIGVRPTFETDGARKIESFLLDFDGDLYTKQLRLEFVSRLRGEVAFESVKQLVAQMKKDVEQTREILSSQ